MKKIIVLGAHKMQGVPTLATPHASHDGHYLQKKKCIYTFVKKLLYVKLTYCDHSNKNVKQLGLRITKSWVQQK